MDESGYDDCETDDCETDDCETDDCETDDCETDDCETDDRETDDRETDDRETEVRISDTGGVAAALPFLLGFRPEESVLLIGLGGESGGRITLTVRADLPPPRHTREVAGALARGVATENPTAVVIAVVSEADDEPTGAGPDLPQRDLVHELVVTLADRGIPVREALLVRRGRWWSYDCPHPCCAPGAGTPLPRAVSPLAAASVVNGQVLAGSREELEARIAPSAERGGAAMSAALLRVTTESSLRTLEVGASVVAEESWAAVREAVGRHEPGTTGPRLSDAEVVRVCWGLRDPEVRDRALRLAVSDDAAAAEELWAECTRRAPAPFDAGPATLLAVHAWLRGDGAMANVALDRAVAADPGHALAHSLRDGLAACVRPEVVRALILAHGRADDVPAAG